VIHLPLFATGAARVIWGALARLRSKWVCEVGAALVLLYAGLCATVMPSPPIAPEYVTYRGGWSADRYLPYGEVVKLIEAQVPVRYRRVLASTNDSGISAAFYAAADGLVAAWDYRQWAPLGSQTAGNLFEYCRRQGISLVVLPTGERWVRDVVNPDVVAILRAGRDPRFWLLAEVGRPPNTLIVVRVRLPEAYVQPPKAGGINWSRGQTPT